KKAGHDVIAHAHDEEEHEAQNLKARVRPVVRRWDGTERELNTGEVVGAEGGAQGQRANQGRHYETAIEKIGGAAAVAAPGVGAPGGGPGSGACFSSPSKPPTSPDCMAAKKSIRPGGPPPPPQPPSPCRAKISPR